jgi:hypothetical protein
MWNFERSAWVFALSCQTAFVFAAVPGAGGVISACYDVKGSMRVIDAEAGATCSAKETPLTFNATGSTGPQGPAGPSDAYVKPIDGFSPMLPGSVQTIARLRVPGGEYVVNALMRFNVATVAEGEIADVYCEMIAEVGGTGELDVFSVSFNSTEDNGFIKLAPMTGWVTAGGDFDIRIDCQVFQSPGTSGVGVEEGRLVAVKYGDVHTPPPPPPD